MSSQHGSARSRQGYVSSVVSAQDFLVHDSETKESQSLIVVSDSFKRSDADNAGILKKRGEKRRELKREQKLQFRAASKERSQRRKEIYDIESDFCELIEEVEHQLRSHPKRHERRELRKQHRMLMQSRERHLTYLKLQQIERRMLRDEFDELSSLFANSTLMIEAGDQKTPDETNQPLRRDSFSDDREPPEEKRSFMILKGGTTGEEKQSPPVVRLFDQTRSEVSRQSKLAAEKMKKIRAKFDTCVSETGDMINSAMGKSHNIFEDLKNSPIYAMLEQCMKGNGDGSYNYCHTIFGNIVSCFAFLRIFLTMPPSFAGSSSVAWLYFKAMGFTNDVSMIGSVGFATFEKLIRVCENAFRSYHSSQGEELSVESLSDSIDGFLSGTNNFLSHPLIVSMRNVVVFLAALHLFEKPVAGEIFRTLGKPEGFSIVSLLTSVLSDISNLIRQGEAWLYGKPGTIDLLADNSLTSAVSSLTNHIEMQDLVYTGLPLAGFTERSTYITQLKSLIDEVEDRATKANKVEVKRLKVPLLLGTAKKTLGDFTSAAVSSFRQTPIGIIIHGPPGVGKSHVTKFIAYIHSLVKGRKFAPSLMYTRVGEFWEGYQPFCHPYIHYSEGGKMKKSQARAKGDPINDELLSVIDNLPYPVNMAFKDKGKIFALPEMVLIDTNNPSLNFEEMYENPAAFRRRFIYIEPKVRAAWSVTKQAGGEFDKSIPGADEVGADAWLFKVTTQKPLNNVQSEEKVLLDFSDQGGSDALIKLLVPMFVKHIAYEEKILQGVSTNLFSKFDSIIIQTATPLGAFKAQEAKVDVADGCKVKIDPNSPYAKVFEGKLASKVREVYDETRTKVEKTLMDSSLIRKLIGTEGDPFSEKDTDSVCFDIVSDGVLDSYVEEDKSVEDSPEVSPKVTVAAVSTNGQPISIVKDEKELEPEEEDPVIADLQKDLAAAKIDLSGASLHKQMVIASASSAPIKVEVAPETVSEFKDLPGIELVVGPRDKYTHLIELLELPFADFEKLAKLDYVLSDCAYVFLKRFSAPQLTDYAYSLGMWKTLRLRRRMTDGVVVPYLEAKDIFSGEWKFNSDVIFDRDRIVLPSDKFHNLFLIPMNGWKCMYDAWHWCNKEFYDKDDVPATLVSESGSIPFPYEVMWEIPLALWSMALFFFMRLWFSNNLIMNTWLTPNRIFLLIFTLLCVWYQYHAPWIVFMTSFMVFTNVRENLKVQGTAIVNKAIEDGLDNFGFSLGKFCSWNTGEVDKTPRRGYVKYKMFLKIAGILLAGLAIYQVGAAIGTSLVSQPKIVAPRKRKDEEVTQIVNVTVGSSGTQICGDSHQDKDQILNAPDFNSETTFSKPSPYDEEINDKETKYQAGNSIVRIPNKIDPDAKWNTWIRPPPKYTGASSDFLKMIGYNCRVVTVDHKRGQRISHVLGLFENFALIHRHAFFGEPLGSMVMVSTTGYAKTEEVARATYVSKDSIVDMGNDLMLIQLNEIRFSNIMKHIPSLENMPSKCSGFVARHDTYIAHEQRVTTVKDGNEKVTLKDYYVYQWPEHEPGMCGVPVVAQAGKGWVLVGVHSAGCKKTNVCAASTIDTERVHKAVALLRDATALCPLASASVECLETEAPHPKSVIHYEGMQGANYFGKLKGNIIMPGPSKVVPTGLNENGEVDAIFADILEHKCTTQYGPPPMGSFRRDGQYYSPINRFAAKIGQQKQALDRAVLSKCIRLYEERIVSGIRARGRTELKPWKLETAINGAVQDAYARAMDLSKASGFGRKGKKQAYFDVTMVETGKWAEAIASLRRDVLSSLNSYEQGESQLVFFEACLKDEPRDLKKCAIGKTRTFCVSPLVNLIITRMFFGPIFSTMVEDGDIFCTAIGIDMHRCAQDLYNRLAGHSDLILELDYGNYDQTMPYELGWAAGSVVYRVCKAMGYNDAALQIVSGLVSDNLHPFVVMQQDVFELPGYQPSGKYGTAEDNSLRGVLMLMYAWYSPQFQVHLKGLDFFKEVIPYVYGDDVVAAVSKKVSYVFDNITYAAFCEEQIGLEATPATKNATFSSFVTLDTMMFLKRRFKKHQDFDRIVAPLDLDSLMKTLSWHIPSNSVSTIEQIESALDSVIREIFFHCNEEKFKLMSNALYDLVETKHKLSRGTIKRLKYMELATATLCFSEQRPVEEGRQDKHTDYSGLDNEDVKDIHSECLVQEEAPAVKVKSANLNNLPHHGSDEKDYEWTSENQLAQMSERLMELQIKVIAGKAEPQDFEEIKALRLSIDFLRSLNGFVVQSEMISGNSDATETKMENLRDVSGSEVDVHSGPRSFASFSINQTDVDLRKFLSRPIMIGGGPINLDTGFSANFDVYNVLLQHPNVRAKLRNFALFRASLGIRLTISGTQFHQGRIMMGWFPWYNQCPSTSLAMNSADLFSQTQYMSTIKHQATIDIKSNMPAELHIPYLSVQPMGRLYNDSPLALPATSDFDDFTDMGRLCIRSIGVPEAVTAAPTTPSYQLYAWFEDITYTMATSTKIELVVESDERKVGPIERVSSKMTQVFSKLKSTPVIGPYALASSMISSSVSEVASILGWSRPSHLSDPARMRNEPFPCGANTIGSDLAHRITFDPQQELTVDPSVLGVDHDEMTISDLCSREQLLYQATWTTGQEEMDPFFYSVVNPGILSSSIFGVAIPSPMALCSSYFNFWHGDITFRFDVVKTSFHRGKFAVVWEPNVPQNGLINASLNLNTNYIYIVDLQETDNFEVTVKWAFPRAWAATASSKDLSKVIGSSFGAVSPGFYSRCCNGYIALVPITQLQAPLDRSIHINVYVKSYNMHFNEMRNPRDLPWDGQPIGPGLREMKLEAESEDVGGSPSYSITINTAATDYDGISIYHFGEEPHSMRSVLKRFVTMAIPNVVAGPVIRLDAPITPPLDPAEASSSLTWIDKGRLGILRRCFVGMRGGFKYRLRIQTDSAETAIPGNSVMVSLRPETTVEAAYTVTTSASYADFEATNYGSTVFVPFTQPGMEIEVPFYSTALFHFAQRNNPLPTAYYTDPYQIRNWRAAFLLKDTGDHRVIVDYVTGDDFNLLHFLSAPFMVLS